MSLGAGEFDRRIEIWVKTPVRDADGDELDAVWAFGFKRWAKRRDARPVEKQGAQETLREVDTVWITRADSVSRELDPAVHRVHYKGRVFEIVGRSEADVRNDDVALLCCSRPDMRGDRAPEVVSG